MSTEDFLNGHFLIAMPSLDDPNFSRTVTYVCEHTEEGALGIVINRPTEVSLGELLEHMSLPCEAPELAQTVVYMGGPVQRDRGFVLHAPSRQWESSLQISDEVAITTSRDILEAVAAQEGPERFLIALGYAGWGAGQLEQELAENSWLSGPADSAILFERAPSERWQAAASLLGVDLNLLAPGAGHA
ncbi:YqgE/AlgH family protein [Alkalilimnicola sp. S0819]|uniref:YqgE/AlgH family protein n=1 Tax=Alkalilimnicola sp. S0819 TaxID=2613922 RepID=UPI0012624BEE|nr:YqgE/AlgH family protein [Alkalilimnicola sp. S0819]KAB7624465.1 YqgE/AlgH family protein [Alkalilimnicola sp. S0819]MPQ16301.1 YqgE/AlgH family protein [Alkalilimnicola sp. S0819]